MAQIKLDMSSFKSSGVYTVELDHSMSEIIETNSMRLVPGFSEKPPFNRPIYLANAEDKKKIYGSTINTKLERNGCYFERSLDILLKESPVIALNLLNVDTESEKEKNPDTVGLASFALSCADASNATYNMDGSLYKGRKDRYFEFFDRSRFWIPSANNLLQVAAGKGTEAKDLYKSAPIFNIVNTGTSDVTVFMIKDSDVLGYNMTFANWYQNEEIPYKWINPSDLVSDYFVKLYVLKGNWTNFKSLSTDVTWSKFFDEKGLKVEMVNKFIKADGVSVIGSWSGTILPNFYNKSGDMASLEPIVNSYTEQTGVMIAFNEAAMESIVSGNGNQYYDADFNDEFDDSIDTTPATYKIDMVGHLVGSGNTNVKFLSYGEINPSTFIRTYAASEGDKTNTFIVECPADDLFLTDLTVGTYVECENGLSRIIKKEFKGDVSNKTYKYKFTCSDDVKFTEGNDENYTINVHQPLHLAFTHIQPTMLKGLTITNRHRPGFNSEGNYSIEDGINKIYGMLMDPGMVRGLKNRDMIAFRYIVDTMAGGLEAGLGGKKNLAELAREVGKCTALVNFPSVAEMRMSSDPLFCDANMQYSISKSFDTKYIPTGGNQDAFCSSPLTMPTKEEGADYIGVFSPFLKYRSGMQTIIIPPAAHVANAYNTKYTGGDPYATIANMNGIINDSAILGVEYMYDDMDRDNLEPYGVNPIIMQDGKVKIYGDRTGYQDIISDLNYLHVRELLNTIELECQEVLRKYVFKVNNALTRAEIVRRITPLLDEKLSSGALYTYNIVMDETNNTAEIINNSFGVIDIYVTCSKNMEKIVQRIIIEKLTD